jgi:RimJ/RimL family protein N-acetyltransferase
MKQKIESDRLLLRPFKQGDEEAVFAFAGNKEVAKYTGDKICENLAEAKKIITDVWYKDYEQFGYGRWAVIYKPDNKLIGFCGLKYLSEANITDLGYRFLPQYWHKGIATESSKMILDYSYKNFEIDTLFGFVMPENPASAKVLEKVGFSYLKTAPYPGEEDALLWYRLTKKDYLKTTNTQLI